MYLHYTYFEASKVEGRNFSIFNVLNVSNEVRVIALFPH